MSVNETLLNSLQKMVGVKSPPECSEIAAELRECIEIMHSLPRSVRPTTPDGNTGSLIVLKPNLVTLIVPDLHGRRDFFYRLMHLQLFQGRSFLELMDEGQGQVVCVGDAFHGEAPVRDRWQAAYKEFIDDYKHPKAMNLEMADNLRLLQMIIAVKRSYPESFFFLKGNHENIANEMGAGNYPFRKFVNEGEMVKYWTERFLGEECFDLIYQYEKSLPLAVEGDGFLVTHAEPVKIFDRDDFIAAYEDDEVLYGLTWTDNGEADEGSVAGTLSNIFPQRDYTICFGGHRPVRGLYALRNEDRYVQINHPVHHIAAIIRRGEDFDPDQQILRIDIKE